MRAKAIWSGVLAVIAAIGASTLAAPAMSGGAEAGLWAANEPTPVKRKRVVGTGTSTNPDILGRRTIGSADFCAAYAREAVAENESVRGNSCGLSGPRHAASYADHLAWCSGTPWGLVNEEGLARRTQIAACPADQRRTPQVVLAAQARCNAYADEAVALNRQATDYACGLGADGGRHQATRAAHYGYCMNAPRKAVDDEAARRRADVEACATCRSYSRTAVDQIARSKTCTPKPSGALWMPADEEPHFQACFINRVGVEAPFVNPTVQAFQDQREAALRACMP